MEAAGLVLGVIPLAIQGLKTYRNILSSLRTAKRDLDCLIRDLETEQQILQNTCEILLKGIAPDSALDAMIMTPLGANWDAYSDEVRLRLWPSATLFKDRIEDMREAAMELQRRLAIDGNGKYGGSCDVWVTIEVLIRHHNLDLPNWGFKLTKTAIMQTRFSDRSSILTEWKQNAHFSLNKKDYKDMLARLKDGNGYLNTLAIQHSALEPTRRTRSQSKLARLIRKLSGDIYVAFHNAMKCSCSHNLGLSMSGMARKDVILAGEDEECAAKAIPFDVVFGSTGEMQRWDRLRVQLADNQAPRTHKPPVLLSPTESAESSSRRMVRWPASLVHRESQTANSVIQAATLTDSSLHLSASIGFSPGSPTPTASITNLCHTLYKGKTKASSFNCYGHISCRSSRFNLYHQDCQPEHLRAISLRAILQEQEALGDHSNFNYAERLKVALALSYSVLHLYKTPWLAKIVTPEDIVFLREQRDSQQPFYYLDRPFLSKSLAMALPSTNQDRATHAKGRPIDLTILSLGLLLIQIMIGRHVDDLGLSSEIRMDSTLEKKRKASEYISSVMESGGINYADAVQWCLGSILSMACLDDERFAQDFHGAVIVRLEGDLGLQAS